MLWPTYRPAVTCGAFAVALVLAGCQTYQSRPLNPDTHRVAWHDRAADDQAVQAFAEKLLEAGAPDAVAFDPADGLSLAEAEMVALVYNPDLRLARLRADVAAATAEHAGLWDDPVFSIDVLRITESVSNPWVVSPGLSLTIPVSGRLQAEKARADAAMRVELERIVEAEWQTRYEVRLAWLDWSAATLRAQEQERVLESVQTLVDSTGRLVEFGELKRTEAALFAIEQSQRRYELRRLTGEIAEAEQRLRSLMGLSPGAAIELQPSLPIPAMAEQIDGPATLVANPMLSRLAEEYEVAERTLYREIRKQYPDITVGPLYESDQGQSRIGLLGGIPVPILNANKQGIAEAEAERNLARAEYETAYERLVGEIAGVRARAESLAAERELLIQEMAPLVDRQLENAKQLLDIGEGGALILLESIVRAHDTKMHLIDVRRDEAKALTQLLHLIGPATTGTEVHDNIDQPNDNTDEVTP